MGREQYGRQEAAATEQAATSPPFMMEAAAAATALTFATTAGALPPVDMMTTPDVAPTASERAYEDGPGARKLAQLIAVGTPAPEAVVEVLDAHRDEHGPMIAMISQRLGNAYAQQVLLGMSKLRASLSRRELVAGDPGDPTSGYMLVSQREGGARWRTADGDFSGRIDRNGLDSRYQLDSDDALHAHVGKNRTGTLAWQRDGKNMGELYGRYGNSGDHEAGVRRDFDVGQGRLTGGLRHRVDGLGATDGAYAIYQRGTTTTEAGLGVRNGELAQSLGVTHSFGGGYSGAAQVQHGAEGTTGSIAGLYADPTRRVDGNLTRGVDQTSAHLGASQQLTPQLSMSGRLDHLRPDQGQSQTTLGVSERYRSGNVLQGVDVEAGTGARDYLRAAGSIDAQLGPRLYGGAFGTSEIERGHASTAQLGASLTFTSSEKTALTLAGLVDQDGNLETRLQLDVFKSKIESIGDLDSNKKKALVSLFVSYTQGSDQRRLDGRFGAPQLETGGGGQVTTGIRIKF